MYFWLFLYSNFVNRIQLIDLDTYSFGLAINLKHTNCVHIPVLMDMLVG